MVKSFDLPPGAATYLNVNEPGKSTARLERRWDGAGARKAHGARVHADKDMSDTQRRTEGTHGSRRRNHSGTTARQPSAEARPSGMRVMGHSVRPLRFARTRSGRPCPPIVAQTASARRAGVRRKRGPITNTREPAIRSVGVPTRDPHRRAGTCMDRHARTVPAHPTSARRI